MPVLASAFFFTFDLQLSTKNMKTSTCIYNGFFVIFILLFGVMAQAQVTVTKVATDAARPVGDGFFYTLPKTVLRVDLVLEKIDRIPGPLASFASDYLGVDDVIRNKQEEYRLLESSVVALAMADVDQMYYVQLPEEKGKDERNMSFYLSEIGALVSVNDPDAKPVIMTTGSIDQTIVFTEGSDSFNYLASYNKKKKQDTIVRKITIDTVTINRFLFKSSWVDKSEKERAEEAAQQITKIREARFNLLTGYHEVNFGESIRYMDANLEKMEQEYLQLFLGKESSTIISQTVYYTPRKGERQAQLWRAGNGESVSLEINTDGGLKGLSDSPAAGPNMLFYRVPASATVTVKFSGNESVNNFLQINQLGAVSTVPLSKTKLHLNPLTGNVMSVQKD